MKKFYVINNPATRNMFNGATSALDIVPMNELSRYPRNAILIEAPDEETGSTTEANAAAMRRATLLSLVCVSALSAGVQPERIGALCKLVDIDGIDPTAPNASMMIDAAVDAALDAVPELLGNATVPSAQDERRAQMANGSAPASPNNAPKQAALRAPVLFPRRYNRYIDAFTEGFMSE